MKKQHINLGQTVDDGRGDYLRRGGSKINDNFDMIFHHLGDDETVHESGAWKTKSDPVLNPSFGRSLALDSSKNKIIVNLPKGRSTDYNKTIKLRDVWKTWAKNPITLIAATGDTIKGSKSVILNKEYMDIELVYCSPGRWEYVENKRINKITNAELSTVAKKSFVAKKDQKTFTKIFGNDQYNVSSVEVYYRGNMLYYGDEFTDKSEYGSIGPDGKLGPLDGDNITLAFPCEEGDTVIVVTYMDGIASWRTSYTRNNILLKDSSLYSMESEPGSILVKDLSGNSVSFTKEELGFAESIAINPNAIEIYVNGVLLTEGSTGNLNGYCTIEGINDRVVCESLSGEWIDNVLDYDLSIDNDEFVGVEIGYKLSHNDLITVKVYNNNLGTLMEWADIREQTQNIFLSSEEPITATKIEYTDYDNPSQSTMRRLPQVTERAQTISQLFEYIYPVGTVYTNAHNEANPSEYMGFGMWKRFMEGRVLVSWSTDSNDSLFGINNNDLDSSGNATHTSGGTGGSRSVSLTLDNIPELTSDSYILVKNKDGNVVIGSCEFDPGEEGPALHKYVEEQLKINEGTTTPIEVSIVQPYVTVHQWIRVA